MASIMIPIFGGRKPKLNEKLLDNHMAQTASDVNLEEGTLQARQTKTAVTTHTSLTPKTLWKYGTTFIIFANGEVNNVANSPVEESLDRFMWTDGAYPKQSDSSTWDSAWRLGVIAPTATPTIAIQGAADDDVQDIVSYCFTMVTSWGEESAPSPVTAVTTIYGSQHVHLSVLTTPAGSGNDWAYKNIYRLSSGQAGAEYMYLDQIAHGSTTYNDDGGGGELKAVSTDALATENWDQPPNTIAGIMEAHNGMMIGYNEKILHVSEPYIPYAWPSAYELTFDTDITGIGASGQYILVVSGTAPYIVTGQTPDSLTSERLPLVTKCDNQRSVVSCEKGIFFSSPKGLMLVQGGNIQNVTENFITTAQWQTLTGSNVIGAWRDNKYFGFKEGANTGFKIDLEKQELTTFTMQAPHVAFRDVYHDATTDNLYVLSYDGSAHSYTATFETTATLKDYVWKSKKFMDEHRYNCGKIIGAYTTSGTTLEFKYIIDGSALMTKKVFVNDAQPTAENTGDWWFDSNDSYTAYYWTGSAWTANVDIQRGGMFRIPSHPSGKSKEIQLTGTIEVESIQLATAPEELI